MNEITTTKNPLGLSALLPIHDDEQFPIDGRELHAALKIETRYNDWFPRMCEYGFQEGQDFNLLKNERVQIEGHREVMRTVLDHKLTISMAKEIAMLQRTDMGRDIRRYLISVEEMWNSPEMVMSRALQFANKRFELYREKCADLEEKILIMGPKADYFDDIVDRGLNNSFRTTAKQLHVSEKQFIRWLLEHRYIYRDEKGRLQPYAHYAMKDGGLFDVKDCRGTHNRWAGTQTLITPKGRETFRLLIRKDFPNAHH